MIAKLDTPLRDNFALFSDAWLATKKERTRKLYGWALDHFEKFLERPALMSDLNDPTVGRLLGSVAEGREPRTANLVRDKLLCFWRWCCRHGLASEWPEVPAVPQPEKLPRGWTVDQVERLLFSCSQETGLFGGVNAAPWWKAWHLLMWDTGERSGAMLALRWDWLDWEAAEIDVPGRVRKAGKPMRYGLSEATLAALRAIEKPERKLIFPVDGGHNGLYHRYKRICRRAELKYKPPRAMRISFASHFEAAGGNATDALAHSSRKVTLRYLDPSIAKREPSHKRMPRLGEQDGKGTEAGGQHP